MEELKVVAKGVTPDLDPVKGDKKSRGETVVHHSEQFSKIKFTNFLDDIVFAGGGERGRGGLKEKEKRKKKKEKRKKKKKKENKIK